MLTLQKHICIFLYIYIVYFFNSISQKDLMTSKLNIDDCFKNLVNEIVTSDNSLYLEITLKTLILLNLP